jgi:hypothetical protein
MSVIINGDTGINKITDGSIVTADFASTVPLGTKNLIINGNMQIAQRGTSANGEGATEGYKTVDRWNYTTGGTATAGRFTLTQDTADAPKDQGFGYCTKFDCTTADTSIAAGEALVWRTKLEGQTLQAIKKGTANAEPITFSFWAKGTAATYVVELHDEDNNRHNTQKFTITSSWQKFTLTFAADTTGTFNNDNGASLGINFWLHAGSNYTSGTFTSNTWATRTLTNIAVGIDSFYSSTANEFFITGVQLEVGENATPFENRMYSQEFAMCQRYYFFQDQVQFIGYQPTGQLFAVMNYFPISMRASPTLTVFDYAGASGKVFLNANNVTGNIDISQKNSCRVYASTTTTGSQTFGYTFKADAEL